MKRLAQAWDPYFLSRPDRIVLWVSTAGPSKRNPYETRGEPNGSPRAIMHFHVVSPKQFDAERLSLRQGRETSGGSKVVEVFFFILVELIKIFIVVKIIVLIIIDVNVVDLVV